MARNKEDKIISANDCYPFLNLNNKEKEALETFVSAFKQESVFNFSNKKKNKKIDFTDEPFATYDYYYDQNQRKLGWVAGRWVGSQKNGNYTFTVNPRFGILSLVSMFDEIFSMNMLDNLSEKNNNE